MKVSIPKGTRDFGPQQVLKRKYIFNTIERIFQKYAFVPIETPVFENLSTLQGKYGDEGDNLIFKVLNNGDYLAKADQEALDNKDSRSLTPSIARRGMRYDLTVPFARFVVMHQNEIHFPFKRYQIQPVWRADRPQKGRYQEFYQCDADVVGSDSLMYESELVQVYDEVFTKLKIPVTIRINHRQMLAGIAEYAGINHLFTEMTTAIDKLDKIGANGVLREMITKGIPEGNALQVLSLLEMNIEELKAEIGQTDQGSSGIKELEQIFKYISNTNNQVKLDFTLARGLSYYTGCIYEVTTDMVKIGSLGGGGRYAGLTTVFGLPNVSGVGISFGAERIYDVMEEMDLFTDGLISGIKILLLTFDEECHYYGYQLILKLRSQEIPCDIYPKPDKFKKQMKYANALKVPFVGIIGPEEMENSLITLKNMQNGDQQKLNFDDVAKLLQRT